MPFRCARRLTNAACCPQTCALLRQLSEKLDLLRGVAGDVLSRLLNDPEAPLVGMPQRATLKKLFKLRDRTTPSADATPGGGSNATGAGASAGAGAGAVEAKAGGDEGDAGEAPASTERDERVVNWTAPTQCYPVVVKVRKRSA